MHRLRYSPGKTKCGGDCFGKLSNSVKKQIPEYSLFIFLWVLIDRIAWKILFGWGSVGEDTERCLFAFSLGIPNNESSHRRLGPCPQAFSNNETALFCSLIVSFVSLPFPLEVVNSFARDLLFAFFGLFIYHHRYRTYFCLINTLGHKRRYVFVFSFNMVFLHAFSAKCYTSSRLLNTAACSR